MLWKYEQLQLSFLLRFVLTALSDKSDTMEALRRSHLPVVQTLSYTVIPRTCKIR